MRRFFPFISVLLLSVTLHSQDKRLALIIGNSAYEHGGILKNPVNDANLMASTLTDLGFDVIKKTNATKAVMDEALLEFWRKLRQYDVALLYYAGHGVQVEGVNYLLPVDVVLEDILSLDIEAIDIGRAVKHFDRFTNKLNIVILDACRDNPFRSWMRGGSGGFNAIPAPSGTLIAFATAAGTTASDGMGNHGLYTEKLTEQMRVEQRIEDVFINTRVAVQKASAGKQSPQEWSQLTGTFMFAKSVKVTVDQPVVGDVEMIQSYGNIELTTELSGELYLDGKPLVSVSAQSKIPIEKVTSGVHRLQIIGVENWEENIRVMKDQTVRISAMSNMLVDPYIMSDFGTFSDSRDSEEYKWIRIGEQIWMAENMNYDAKGSSCYDDNQGNCNTFGRLYNWKASQKVCPQGWHLPADDEWKVLETYLGMSELEKDSQGWRGSDEGGKLKESTTAFWSSPNTGANNESGFTALGGGIRNHNGSYFSINDFAYFWTATDDNNQNAWNRGLSNNNPLVFRKTYNKYAELSIRCIKD